jgi:hypothetical protein
MGYGARTEEEELAFLSGRTGRLSTNARARK